MARVDRNTLRVAIYELLFCADVPKSVILDEAIEVARRFGSDRSSEFVNGILNSVAEDVR